MGTLFGLREPVGRTYARWAARHGLTLEAGRLEQGFRAAYRTAPPLAFTGLEGSALRQAELGWWADRIAASLAAAGAAAMPSGLASELFEHFADPGPWRVYPEVPARLEQWHRQGLRLAVVSNFDSRLPELLERLDLARWFRAVVVSSSAGAAKPDPFPFRQALQQLDLPATAAWHVGDSPEDVAGARAAGLPCVLVRRS
jgi:putative hydrolase of the HAD superfamily